MFNILTVILPSQVIEDQELEVETAAFYSWDFFDYMTEEGYPGVVDHVIDCEWVPYFPYSCIINDVLFNNQNSDNLVSAKNSFRLKQGSVAFVTSKRAAGVAPEVNPRIPPHEG